MTKEITKAFILQQIQDKFKLRDMVPSKFIFEETVIPTYPIGDHLIAHEGKSNTQSITGIGGVVFFAIPGDERHFLNGYTVVFMTGTYTIAGLYITRKNSPSDFLYLDLTAGQTVSYAHFLPRKLTLDPGDQIGIDIDGYTTTGNLRLYLDYGREVIR